MTPMTLVGRAGYRTKGFVISITYNRDHRCDDLGLTVIGRSGHSINSHIEPIIVPLVRHHLVTPIDLTQRQKAPHIPAFIHLEDVGPSASQGPFDFEQRLLINGI